MTVPDTAPRLPETLSMVGEHIANLNAAWALVCATGLDDEQEMRRYTYETECAMKAGVSLLDFYFTCGDMPTVDDDPEGAF